MGYESIAGVYILQSRENNEGIVFSWIPWVY